jgi:hypothetical protein
MKLEAGDVPAFDLPEEQQAELVSDQEIDAFPSRFSRRASRRATDGGSSVSMTGSTP